MSNRSSSILAEAVCADCLGILFVHDDGSVTGTPDTPIPCDCTAPCLTCEGQGRLYGLWVIDSALEWYEEGWRTCYTCKGDGNKPGRQGRREA
jgi:hypothetical protein